MFRSMCKRPILCLFFLCLPEGTRAADHLLYFEAQGIAGYSSQFEKPVTYSMNPDAEMQKPDRKKNLILMDEFGYFQQPGGPQK